jgi:hypothetical protein
VNERARALIQGTLAAEMPFNDPHTAAPRLWSYRHAVGMRFEVSAAAIELPKRERLALECRLIWLYRRERGQSPLCNFGRMHPRYLPPRNRKTGHRGRRLLDGEPDNDGGASVPPLPLVGEPATAGWLGLTWSPARPLRIEEVTGALGPGVYRIGVGGEVVYLGEASVLGARLRQHCGADWGAGQAWFSYARLAGATRKAQRLEVENDLIGAFVSQMGRLPRAQFFAEETPAEAT